MVRIERHLFSNQVDKIKAIINFYIKIKGEEGSPLIIYIFLTGKTNKPIYNQSIS